MQLRYLAAVAVSLLTSPALAWDVQYFPPVMSSPITVYLPADFPIIPDWPAYSGHCKGSVYRRTFPADQDVIVRFNGTSPLQYPVQIQGGRNIRVVGLDISIVTQPLCADGAAQEVLKVPGGIALDLTQAGTSFVEGLKLDLNGHMADCIVATNYNLTEAQALANRNVVIQNSACRGSRGTWPGHPYGDFAHADFWQNQGSPNAPMNSVIFENISQLTTATGVVIDGKVNSQTARNVEYALDTRYSTNLHVLNPLWFGSTQTNPAWSFENIWTNFDENGGYGGTGWMPIAVRVESAGTYYSYKSGPSVVASAEIHRGIPPQSFAPWSELGANYVSPHDVDTVAPSVPTGLSGTAISSSQINLTWTASADNIAVTGYKVFRNGTQIGTSTAVSYSDTGLAASTAYSYTVAAYDAAGNTSAQSTSVSVTTQANSGLPDVIVTALSYNPVTGIFTSVVKNQGPVATPIDKSIGVGYKVDGVNRTWGGYWPPPGLAAGASVTIGSDGGAYTIPNGTHTILAIADDVDRFLESDENNNTLSQVITIGAASRFLLSDGTSFFLLNDGASKLLLVN